jgi:probable HAF family extracellular repeat protein
LLTTYSIADLGTFLGGATSAATAINTAGDICGWSDRSDGYTHAFLRTHGTTSLTDLGTIGGVSGNSKAYGLNNQTPPTVVGQSDTTADGLKQHGFYYDTTMHDVGTIAGDTSLANGVNESKVVVGGSNYLAGQTANTMHAFAYDSAGIDDLGSWPTAWVTPTV